MVSHAGSVISRKKKFFDFFPPPKYMMLSSEGIAISDSAVQFIQFGKSSRSGGLELVHCAEAPLAPGIVENGAIENREGLSKALGELKQRFGVKFVHATLPEERVYVFTVTLEKVPYDNLRDAVAFTIEDNAPVSLAESIFDFEIIGETEGKNEVKVAVSVLPVDVVETYTAAFESAGITPISFDVESQAMARALVPRDDARAHLIINLSAGKTGLYVAEEEVVQFTTTLSLSASETDIEQLRAEMRKLFAYWNTRFDKRGQPGARIERIIFTGQGAKNEAFIAALMTGIEIEYIVGNVWTNAFSFEEYVPDVPFEQSLSLGAAVGVALPIKEVDYV